MSGVDTALFANDACGQPVPWEHCCPWIYFDGKLFQSKLIKAGRDRVSLIELCDGQVPACQAAAKSHFWSAVGLNGQEGEQKRDIGKEVAEGGECVWPLSNLVDDSLKGPEANVHAIKLYAGKLFSFVFVVFSF